MASSFYPSSSKGSKPFPPKLSFLVTSSSVPSFHLVFFLVGVLEGGVSVVSDEVVKFGFRRSQSGRERGREAYRVRVYSLRSGVRLARVTVIGGHPALIYLWPCVAVGRR